MDCAGKDKAQVVSQQNPSLVQTRNAGTGLPPSTIDDRIILRHSRRIVIPSKARDLQFERRETLLRLHHG